MPYLCGTVPLFSTLKILHIKGLRSFASIRLYEFTNQLRASGVRHISLAELREFLATKEARPRFADFKRKVIDKAVAQINEKTGMDLPWQQVKKTRAVSGIKFFIKTNKQTDFFPH